MGAIFISLNIFLCLFDHFPNLFLLGSLSSYYKEAKSMLVWPLIPDQQLGNP